MVCESHLSIEDECLGVQTQGILTFSGSQIQIPHPWTPSECQISHNFWMDGQMDRQMGGRVDNLMNGFTDRREETIQVKMEDRS